MGDRVSTPSSTTPLARLPALGDSLGVFIRREDAKRFIEEVRGDDPELACHLRIKERELEAGGLNKRRTVSRQRLADLRRRKPASRQAFTLRAVFTADLLRSDVGVWVLKSVEGLLVGHRGRCLFVVRDVVDRDPDTMRSPIPKQRHFKVRRPAVCKFADVGGKCGRHLSSFGCDCLLRVCSPVVTQGLRCDADIPAIGEESGRVRFTADRLVQDLEGGRGHIRRILVDETLGRD